MPIGVFDSGIGGLSILNALRAQLPQERFVYFADTGHAPYGERSDEFVAARTTAIARHLRERHRIKALVVACNTATAAAIHELRAEHPDLPVIGVEPALKPAVKQSRTGHIAVLATRVTVESRKFQTLLASLDGQARFSIVPCDGLAGAIERVDPQRIAQLCRQHLAAAGSFGSEEGRIDTLVLGCTHYPFVADELRRHVSADVRFIDTGAPVALQTERLLAQGGQLGRDGAAEVLLIGTGSPAALDAAAGRWLELPAARAQAAEAEIAAAAPGAARASMGTAGAASAALPASPIVRAV